jgi:tRNA pseudouridine55 synthase
MDGVLVIDKPSGPTSHDVVARVRRATVERHVGHTGTLDPLATGVLPLVAGKATRLARFFSGARKTYLASIALGVSTDSHDADGLATGGVRRADPDAPLPSRQAVEAVLAAFTGEFDQQPPMFSAKQVGGVRAYRVARRARRAGADAEETGGVALPRPCRVTVHEMELVGLAGATVQVRLTVSAGFYVRALARDLGNTLGCGAHLSALRRTASGEFTELQAVALGLVEADPRAAAASLVPLRALLGRLPGVVLTPQGLARAAHGLWVRREDCAAGGASETWREAGAEAVRLLAPDGDLAAVALTLGECRTWPLHPSIVLT